MATESEELPLKMRMTLFLGKGALSLLAASWRYRVINGSVVSELRARNSPFIFSLWHGQLLPLLWLHRRQGVALLISEHRDGELIARTASALGYELVRGSTTRGGERALLALVRELKRGKEVAITPDGPRGPAARYAPGALVAAQRSGAPIVPIAATADRAWHLKSWDRFIIPKPFAMITVAYGAAEQVTSPTARAAAGEASRFEEIMNRTVSAANG